MLHLKGKIYHCKFRVGGRVFQKSTRTSNLEDATRIHDQLRDRARQAFSSNALIDDAAEIESDWPSLSESKLAALAASLHTGMKHRAAKKGLPCKLTKHDLLDMLNLSGGRCQVTGVPLSIAREGVERTSPWMPSIDRIECTKGYTRSNCRITCYLANLSMSQYGEKALELMLHYYCKKKWGGGKKFAQKAA